MEVSAASARSSVFSNLILPVVIFYVDVFGQCSVGASNALGPSSTAPFRK